MRCDNCGWDNTDNALLCVKCNTPLKSTKSEANNRTKNVSFFSATISENQSLSNVEKAGSGVQETQVGEKNSFAGYEEMKKDILVPCPNPACGYLNSKEATICPKCKTLINNTTTENGINMGDAGTAMPYTRDTGLDAKFNAGTIDPYRLQTNSAKCFLEIVPKEREENNKANSLKEFVFENVPIALNRNNLDEKNNTITSKVQAELTFEDGKWYLSDKSELKTTFIIVNEKTELKEGDMIVMGDRKFIFSLRGGTNF